jgi:alcohol dehydrogenase class IV
MEANLRLAQATGATDTVRRYDDVARALGARDASAGIERVRALCAELGVPGLAAYGMTKADVPDIAARAKLTSSMRANPVDLSDRDLEEILLRAL